MKALRAFYTLLPPRRVEDVSLIILGDNDTLTDLNHNYLIMKDGVPLKVIYFKYKTFKTYGKQEFDIPTELSNILADYIKEANLQDTNFLFGKNHVKKHINFSVVVTKAFAEVIKNKKITANTIRHSAIMDFFDTKRSTEEKKKFAYSMGTSVSMLHQYDRLE
jgi:hypothetical protein